MLKLSSNSHALQIKQDQTPANKINFHKVGKMLMEGVPVLQGSPAQLSKGLPDSLGSLEPAFCCTEGSAPVTQAEQILQ